MRHDPNQDPVGGAWAGLRRAALCLGMFFASWLAAQTVQYYLVRHVMRDRGSLDYFLRHKDAFNVVFAGSSLVETMIDPLAFDAAMAARGYLSRSFNLGRRAAWAHETNYRLRQVLRRNPERLDIVVIEADRFSAKLSRTDAGGDGTERDLWWHDLAELPHIFRSIDGITDEASIPRLKRQRLELVARRYGLYGTVYRLAARTKFAENEEEQPRTDEAYARDRGYLPYDVLEADRPNLREHHLRFAGNPEGYARNMERRAALLAERRPELPGRYNVRALRAQIERVKGRGILPVYVVPPVTAELYPTSQLVRELERAGHYEGAVVLYFDDPAEYPELFRFEDRFDHNHLFHRGGQRFSRAIAARLADHLDRNSEAAARLSAGAAEASMP